MCSKCYREVADKADAATAHSKQAVAALAEVQRPQPAVTSQPTAESAPQPAVTVPAPAPAADEQPSVSARQQSPPQPRPGSQNRRTTAAVSSATSAWASQASSAPASTPSAPRTGWLRLTTAASTIRPPSGRSWLRATPSSQLRRSRSSEPALRQPRPLVPSVHSPVLPCIGTRASQSATFFLSPVGAVLGCTVRTTTLRRLAACTFCLRETSLVCFRVWLHCPGAGARCGSAARLWDWRDTRQGRCVSASERVCVVSGGVTGLRP